MISPTRLPNVDDDFELREEMIPMRDRVKLHALILSPKRMTGRLPILLMRTPYDSSRRLQSKQRTTLYTVLGAKLAELQGYIFVFQDIRGRGRSSGLFELSRPPRGPYNKTRTDETTDAWDTVEWLTKHVRGNNGRVGIYGTSYEGWTTLMALLDPHPALKAAVPVNPLADGWMGDDWFHNGAFRQAYAFEYVHYMETDPKSFTPFPFSHYDTYAWWLKAGSARELGTRYLDPKRHHFWSVLISNQAYSSYWQRGAIDQLLRQSRARLVPTLHVHGWFDQEDMYGAPAAYEAMKARDRSDTLIYFAAGPWYHGQSWGTSEKAGPLARTEDAARRWREDQLAPFLAHYLKGGPAHTVPPVSVFNTGSRRWERVDGWPRPRRTRVRPLYLVAGGGVSWYKPAASEGMARTFLSDPARPVPYQPRPVRRIFDDELDPAAWRTWLTGDQRFTDGRPDVLTFVGDPLDEPVTVRGTVTAKLFAETTGTDADWVVKLIDAFPDMDSSDPAMSGFQLMISGDIFRGRYRRQFERPEPIAANAILEYAIRLPQVNHTFRRSHRIMVQIQSTWFPLYDRNPQRFIPSIMDAKPRDFQAATHRIHTSGAYPSRIDLRVEG
jgi:putative CocE/NonD family hydrolase